MAKVILVAELDYPSTMVITNNNQLYVQTGRNIVHINNKHIEAFIDREYLIGTDGQDIYSVSDGKGKGKNRVISTKPNKESITQDGLTSFLSEGVYIQVERDGTYFLYSYILLRYVGDGKRITVASWGEEVDDPPYRSVSGYLAGDYTVYTVDNGSLVRYDTFEYIAAIAVDTKGNLYVCETSVDKDTLNIYRADSTGKYTRIDLTGSAIISISNMVVDNYGIIYISSEKEGKIYKIIPPDVKIQIFILRNDPINPKFKLFLTDT